MIEAKDTNVVILMPCAGTGEYFEEAFLSALNQTHKSIRVLILDNAAPSDIYKNVCDRHADPRVSYIRFDDRLPLPENWQRCLSFSGEGCFCFLHDDDVWHPEYLSEALKKILFEKNITAVITWHLEFSRPEEMTPNTCPGKRWENFNEVDELSRRAMLILGDLGHMSATVFKKNVFGFDTSSVWNLDQRLVYSYACIGKIACSISFPVWIRSHPGNASATSRNVRNVRERDEFAKRRLICQMENKPFVERVMPVVRADSAAAYRFFKAVYSWPVDPRLVQVSHGITRDKLARQAVRNHSGKGVLMCLPGDSLKVMASLIVDLVCLLKSILK